MPETDVYEVTVRGTKTRLRLTPEDVKNYPDAKKVKDATAAAKKRHAEAAAEAIRESTTNAGDSRSARTKKRAARTKKAVAAREGASSSSRDDGNGGT